MAEDGKVVIKYVGDTAGIDQANATAEGKLRGLGSKLGGIGLGIAKAVGAAAVAAGAAIIKVGVDFESAFAGVIKTVDATEAELAALRRGILDMSTELPATAVEIAGVAEAAGQLGIETPNILAFTRAMIDLGEATNLTAEEAATQLARFANITGMAQTDFDKLGSTIVALGNNFATTEAEIVAMAMRLAGAGKQAGMTESEIMGLAASLSSVGIEAEAGGTAFSKVITDMNLAAKRGGDRLKEFAGVAGMSAEDFKKAFEQDAAGALQMFINGLSKAEEQGTSTIELLDEMGFTEVRVRDALLRSAGAADLLGNAMGMANEAWEENNALANEAAQRYATLESRWDMLKNQIVEIGIEIYDKLRPALSDALDGFSEMFDALSSSGAMDDFAATLGEVASVLAGAASDLLPVFIDLINDLLPPITEIVQALLPSIVELAQELIPLLGEIVSAILPPLLQVIKEILPVALDFLRSILTPLVDILLPPLTELLQLAVDILSTVMPILKPLLDMLSGAVGSTLPAVALAIAAITDAIRVAIGVAEILLGLLLSIVNAEAGGNMMSSGGNKVAGVISGENSALSKLDAPNHSVTGVRYNDRGQKIVTVSSNKDVYRAPGRNARGTNQWRGGPTWVGEEGPELVNLPTFSEVYPADISRKMAGGNTQTIYIEEGAIKVEAREPLDTAHGAAMAGDGIMGEITRQLRNRGVGLQ